MNLKSILMVSLMTLSAFGAQAAGRQEASEICSSMSFDSSRNGCIAAIGKYDYFEQGAINLCMSMSFDNSKLECASTIGNKSYEPYEITNCEKNSFDSGKNQCLKTSGRSFQSYPGCLSKQDVIFQLQDLDRMIYHGDNNRARSAIYNMINSLQRCP
ncbi:MAG: hypothetical protein ACXWRE_04510 [Pseudobdellovibrionaceae bacterium]